MEATYYVYTPEDGNEDHGFAGYSLNEATEAARTRVASGFVSVAQVREADSCEIVWTTSTPLTH